jgi:hypothetical protein
VARLPQPQAGDLIALGRRWLDDVDVGIDADGGALLDRTARFAPTCIDRPLRRAQASRISRTSVAVRKCARASRTGSSLSFQWSPACATE